MCGIIGVYRQENAYKTIVEGLTPVEAVEAELLWHGGIVEGEMPS